MRTLASTSTKPLRCRSEAVRLQKIGARDNREQKNDANATPTRCLGLRRGVRIRRINDRVGCSAATATATATATAF